MTVSATTPRVQYTITSSNVTSLASDPTSVTFPVTFKYLATSEVKCIKTASASSTDTTLTENTHYTISPTSGNTGTFTFTATGAALFVADDLLTFTRIMERASATFDQTTDYAQNDQLDADTLEQNFDKSIMISQQLKDASDRGMTFSDTATFNTTAETAGTLTGTKTARASKAIKFDANGDIGLSTNDPDEQQTLATAQVALATTQANNAATSASLAGNYATKVDGVVTGSDYSSQAWAVGGTGVTDTASRGAAKEWATKTSGTVDTSDYSAKYWALDAEQSKLAAKASAAAVANVYDNFADTFLGSMADNATATSGSANGTWSASSSSITLASTSGTIEVGQEVTGSGIPSDANVLSVDGSTIVISENMTAAGSSVSLTFTGQGIYGAFNGSKDGPATDNDGDALATGALYFNSTDNEMRVYDGANWLPATSAGSTSLLIYKYLASGSQTTFTGSDANGATLSYVANNILVFLNGVKLDASDFTATNGTSVVLGSGATASDELVVVAFKSFTTADMVPASTGGTFTGNVVFSGNTTNLDVNGTELVLDADGDTSITADTDDQIDIKIGGSDKASIISTGLLIDDINEKTSAHGVEIDGVTLKDSSVMIQSGGSIQFHPHGSSPSNSLDDFEEGTFNFTLGGGLHSSGSANGHYVKIGSYVSISGRFYYPNTASDTITGLPFAVKNSVGSRGGGAIVYQDLDSTPRSILGDLNTTTATIYNFQQSAVLYTASDKQYFFIFSYFTDA